MFVYLIHALNANVAATRVLRTSCVGAIGPGLDEPASKYAAEVHLREIHRDGIERDLMMYGVEHVDPDWSDKARFARRDCNAQSYRQPHHDELRAARGGRATYSHSLPGRGSCLLRVSGCGILQALHMHFTRPPGNW